MLNAGNLASGIQVPWHAQTYISWYGCAERCGGQNSHCMDGSATSVAEAIKLHHASIDTGGNESILPLL